MNYFSSLYQCNMIRVFPLCAGVIGLKTITTFMITSVSPVCGGYRLRHQPTPFKPQCFPCVGVIGEQRTENNA